MGRAHQGTSAVAAVGRFDTVMGATRGGRKDRPWTNMTETERETARQAAAKQLLVNIVHYDGGDYVPDSADFRVRVREARQEIRSQQPDTHGLELVEAVQKYVNRRPSLRNPLNKYADDIAADAFREFLDCGHGPTPSDHGPIAGTFKNMTVCQNCAVTNCKTEMATSNEFGGYLSSDKQTIGTALGGSLARVYSIERAPDEATDEGDDPYEWEAEDETGARWRGVATYGPGGETNMVRLDPLR